MLAIIDYGMGNLYSVKNALDKLNVDSIITNNVDVLKKADKLILPGVGAFKDCMENLNRTGLKDVILDLVKKEQKPLLGICLGMQVLFETSEENGFTKGLGLLKGDIVLMEDPHVHIPHIGWNDLKFTKNMLLYSKLKKIPYVYYDHSYYATNYDEDDLVAYSFYGNMKICGIVIHDHIMGCQFHPEKSAQDGLTILKYFVEDFI